MDIKGVKPVASREKQRPFGAKTNTHFGDRTAPVSFSGAQTMGATARPLQRPASQVVPGASALQPMPTALATMPERKTFAAPQSDSQKLTSSKAPKRKKRSSRRRVVFRMAAVSFVLVATLGGVLAWNGYMKLHKVFHGPAVVAALAPKEDKTDPLDGTGSGRINILLLGVSGSTGTAADLTDTVALLSIDPVNDKATLLNIPTDLWVQKTTSYYGHQELNEIYKDGRDASLGPSARPTDPGVIEAGFNSLDQVVEQVTGVTVNYHLLMNFQAFQQAVDAEGGVTINSPDKLYDSSLGYRNHVSPILATAGPQHMDGNQALLYVRSRVTTDNSSQALRELQLMTALKDQVLSAGTLSDPTKLEALIEGFGDNAFSDLSIKGAEQLYKLMGKVGDGNIESVNLIGNSENLLTAQVEGHMTVAVPTAGLDHYADIQQFIRTATANGQVVKENASVAVMGSTAAGATITGDMLKSYGLNVTSNTVTTQRAAHLTLVDLSGGKDPYALQLLESHYAIKAVNELPAGVSMPTGGAKFVIIEP